MRPHPYVSIGMPVFDGEPFLAEAIESLLDQTFADFELVISDNASTDDSPEVIRKYAEVDPRIRYELQDVNRGAAWNYNRVTALASPDAAYVKWAAADDVHDADYLARTVAILDADPTVALAHTGTADIDEEGWRLKTYHQPVARLTSGDPAERLRDLVTLRHECFQAFGLIRHDVMRGTRGHGAYPGADDIFLAEVALRGRFVQAEDVLFFRRQHSGRSMVAYANARERARWFDPAAADRLQFPMWRLGGEMVRAIQQAPLTSRERRDCYRSLEVFVGSNWLGMLKNVIRASAEAPGVLAQRSFARPDGIERT